MEIHVRPMQEADVEQADRIVRIAFGTFLGVPDPITVFGDSDLAHTRYRASPDDAFVAEVDGQVVGSNFLTRWGAFAFFGPLTVEPRFWDQGIARQLLHPTVERFAEWKCSSAGLFTFGESAKHVSLYQRFGFWPRFLTPIMFKNLAGAARGGDFVHFSSLPAPEKTAMLAACRETTGLIYEGLDVSREILAVDAQRLGDTLLRCDGSRVSAFAVCHLGAGSEAGTGNCYVKFGCARPGTRAAAQFEKLLADCESFASAAGAPRLTAGINMSRHEAYRMLLGKGFRTERQGVAMHRDNDPGFCTPGVFVLDDWR
jgi:predicted N-acetyltransferase YhbS